MGKRDVTEMDTAEVNTTERDPAERKGSGRQRTGRNTMRRNIMRILFLLLLLLSFVMIGRVLKVKSSHGINQKEGIYMQPSNSVDVAFMGTSHIHCGINTALLWEEYGIPAYDYSGAEQPLWMTYYYLRELLKYQKPKMIVLDLYAPARFKENYQYKWISENIYGMKFSLNKLEMLSVSVEPRRIFDYFPSFTTYPGRYTEVDQEDFSYLFKTREELAAFKGYTPYMNRAELQKPEVTTEERQGLTEKSEKYLKKIIQYTKKKGVTLMLIVVPYLITEEDKETYNQIMDIASENDIMFVDYNEYYEAIGIDFSADFNDDSHLNYWGSSKFTQYLGNFLAGEGMQDRRGEEGYESWDENVRRIREYVKQFE